MGTGPQLGFAYQTYNQRVVDKMTARGYQGIRSSHLTVFRLMDPMGSRTTTLARHAGVTKQAMGQLVRELEQMGYLSLSADARDGRAKLAVYTEAGTQLARDSAECLNEVHQEFKHATGLSDIDPAVESIGSDEMKKSAVFVRNVGMIAHILGPWQHPAIRRVCHEEVRGYLERSMPQPDRPYGFGHYFIEVFRRCSRERTPSESRQA